MTLALRTRTLWCASLFLLALALLPLLGLIVVSYQPPIPQPLMTQLSWLEIWSRVGVGRLVLNTLALTLIVTLLALPVGLWLSWVAARCEYKGRRWLAQANLAALAMPSFLLAVTLRQSLGPNGWLGSLWDAGVFRGFWPAVLILWIIAVPYVQLICTGALFRMSVNEAEQARLMVGVRSFAFWRVVLAPLKGAIALSAIIVSLYTMSEFGAVAVLDVQVLTWRLYQAVSYQQLDRAVLLGVILLIATLPVLLAARFLQRRAPKHVTVANPRSWQRVRLRGWFLLLTYAFHFLVVGVGVVIPGITLINWVVTGWLASVTFAPISNIFFTTLWVAGSMAFVITLLAWIPAWLVVRRPSRLSYSLEQALYITSAWPGLLLAFGLLLSALVFARYFDWLDYSWLLKSGILLFLGYFMRFYSEAYAAIKPNLVQFDTRVTENARMLGCGVGLWFRKLALPALLPGMTASYIIVFLALVKELPITLLLGGAMGLQTLSFRVFDRYEEAFLADAGLAGILLMVMTLLLVALSRWRQADG